MPECLSLLSLADCLQTPSSRKTRFSCPLQSFSSIATFCLPSSWDVWDWQASYFAYFSSRRWADELVLEGSLLIVALQTIPWDKRAPELVRIPSTREINAGRGVLHVLVNSLCANSMIYAWTAIQPVFSHTSVSLGGLGMDIQHISLLMAAVAIFQALASLCIFPALHKRLGTARTLLFCGICFFATFQISPLANLLARLGCNEAVWAILMTACITAALQTMASSTPALRTLRWSKLMVVCSYHSAGRQ